MNLFLEKFPHILVSSIFFFSFTHFQSVRIYKMMKSSCKTVFLFNPLFLKTALLLS
jgi:hypothetical protein